ncbi:MAG: FAD-dependent oxidoreductase [Oscillospiraceae bacterium]|jgi:thioredoxin reductase/Fe-S-cluster-containing hydrogenase component 2|nr:FAD-dependent oxidoreductase [Oscillospiraceae bacterium]
MTRYDLIVIGAGPAGLSAAAEAAANGLKVAVFDENARPGGQLFKQIHKFFGSKEHKAKIRGYDIGTELLKEAEELGVEVFLDAVVAGLYAEKEIVVRIGEEVAHFKGDTVIVATGASENMLTFEGWTLPGVMGAGAAQTMMNINRVKPGERVLMLGSGNVGLVVGFQLMQAGCELVALVDAAPRVGGYGVHAAKVARTGVPFYLSHTVVRAEGTDRVTGVTIGEVDAKWQVIPGSEKYFDVDTICIAVGLSSSTQLLKMAGCEMAEPAPGAGYLPVCSEVGETSIPGLYAAGDVSGIEEASSAMIEGRVAGISAAGKLGFAAEETVKARLTVLESALSALHEGMFAPKNRGKALDKTEEGYDISTNLLKKGYLADEEIAKYPGVKSVSGIHPVIECTQNIPCNPCQDSCPKKCITVGGNIVTLPVFDEKQGCIGCGQCIAACSGQAIFLVNEDIGDGLASVTIPYEFLPLPEKGESGTALDRAGNVIGTAKVTDVKSVKVFDHTNLVTFTVPKELGMRARFWRKGAAV